MIFSVNLIKFLILRLKAKEFFALWFFLKLTPIKNHRWDTGIQNIEQKMVPYTVQSCTLELNTTKYCGNLKFSLFQKATGKNIRRKIH